MSELGTLPSLDNALAAVGAAPGSVGLRDLRIASGNIAEVPELVSTLLAGDPGPTALVTDGTAYASARGPVADVLAAGLGRLNDVRRVVLPSRSGRVHADELTCAYVLEQCRGARVLVSLGSGTMADLGKYAARHLRVPVVVVQSAMSVNGFADDQSVLVQSGTKRTVATTWPSALLIDTDIAKRAPSALNLAGMGDLLSMFTALADWRLASNLGIGPAYRAELADLVRPHGSRLLNIASGVRAGDEPTLHQLGHLLSLSGLTMGVAGATAPSSGMEHSISHLLEMSLLSRHREPAWHGLQVGVSTVVASALWQRVREHLAGGDAVIAVPPLDQARGRVFKAFERLDPSGRTSAECWESYARKLRWLHEHADDVQRVCQQWPEIDECVEPLLMAPGTLITQMAAADLPRRFHDLGEQYTSGLCRWAVTNGHRMRDRFTVADLAELLGIWDDQDVTMLLDDLAVRAAGL